MNSPASPMIVVLTAPSGSGKTTIARRMLDRFSSMRFSVSATTRPKRSGEVEGVNYHFLSQDQFEEALLDGALVEYEEVYPDTWYGTLKSELESSSRTEPVLLDIDVEGAMNIKKYYPRQSLVLFIKPPSLDELERRLRARGSETDETLRVRLGKAEKELSYADRFDAIIVNDDIDAACDEVAAHIERFLAIA